jgi:GNAT superfamily N-acetyltransferase
VATPNQYNHQEVTIIHFHPIASLRNPHLSAYLDLYETAFPQEERIRTSWLIQILRAKEEGWPENNDLVVALDDDNQLLGLIHTNYSPALRVMALYYFAVAPQQRSQGLGAQIYQEVLRRCRAAGCRMLIFDLEDPQYCPTLEGQTLARRRIGFYTRQGAWMLEGAQSQLQMYTHLPVAHLRIMAHSLEPVTAVEVLNAARELLNESVEQIGELKLQAP